ncbi:hypothetical protein PSHT_05524 [Puccinia striiformis]|uniref:Uncharacterized protein n=1 Tax=Puccinia striiformis TaxID=27350 RepID=A0A2S4WAD2_9BASI|nr:hypothetical protein PSHT_05524 [Puccinia striiformis]
MVVRYNVDDTIINASKMNASRRTNSFAIGWIRCESNIAAAVNHELTTHFVIPQVGEGECGSSC